jgi:D-alanyl-D-alanine carboxypeptidase
MRSVLGAASWFRCAVAPARAVWMGWMVGMVRFRALGVAAIVGVIVVGGCGSGQSSRAMSAPRRAVDPQVLLERLVRAGAPGAVALVQRDGHVHTYAAGVVDVQTREPMRVDSRFRVGSISKTVIAALILKLVAEQRLRLSDTVARWLPGLVPDGGRITIRELLAQRSGLYDYLGSPQLNTELVLRKTPLSEVWTPIQLLRLATSHAPWFAPGTQFNYSSTNFLVLGLIIERVTNMPLERYAQQTIFAPLGMRSTSFAPGLLAGADAHGYTFPVGPFVAVPGGLGDVERLNGSGDGFAADLVSTAPDLDRFFTALFTGRIIARSLVALMQATRPHEPGLDFQSYGLGLEGSRYPCAMAWGHNGNVWGYSAIVRATRNAGTLIVLLVNQDLTSSLTEPQLIGDIINDPASLYCGN